MTLSKKHRGTTPYEYRQNRQINMEIAEITARQLYIFTPRACVTRLLTFLLPCACNNTKMFKARKTKPPEVKLRGWFSPRETIFSGIPKRTHSVVFRLTLPTYLLMESVRETLRYGVGTCAQTQYSCTTFTTCSHPLLLHTRALGLVLLPHPYRAGHLCPRQQI